MAQEHKGLTRLHRVKIEGLILKISFEEATQDTVVVGEMD